MFGQGSSNLEFVRRWNMNFLIWRQQTPTGRYLTKTILLLQRNYCVFALGRKEKREREKNPPEAKRTKGKENDNRHPT